MTYHYLEDIKLDYTANISNLRTEHEKMINSFCKSKGQEAEQFDYFPIDEKWRILVTEITIRNPRKGMNDFKLKFTRIGKIDFILPNNNPLKLNLFRLDKDNENHQEVYYIYLKDETSGKSSYPLGRFVPVLKEEDSYFIDFNLAYTPACGHIDATACPVTFESTGVAIEAGEKADEKACVH